MSAVVLVLVLVPPMAGVARRYDWAEALQYEALALVVPALAVVAGPWPWLGLGAWARRLAAGRRRHPELLRAVLLIGVPIGVMVFWRAPWPVNSIRGTGWALPAEVVTLVPAGTVLWLECVASPPLEPRSAHPVRIGLCAVTMWSIWVMGYLLAMSRGDWYASYPHPASGLSLAADQQVAAGVLWAVPALCFVPLVFWNLVQWLKSDDDPDQEMHRLVRDDRRRGSPSGPVAR